MTLKIEMMILKTEIETVNDYIVTCEECGYSDFVTDEDDTEAAEAHFKECDWSEMISEREIKEMARDAADDFYRIVKND